MSDSNSLRDALSILGLPLNVSINDIRKRYKKLIHQYHPDKNPDMSHEKISELTEAYKMLIEYAESYHISFKEADIRLDGENWWVKRFGDNM